MIIKDLLSNTITDTSFQAGPTSRGYLQICIQQGSRPEKLWQTLYSPFSWTLYRVDQLVTNFLLTNEPVWLTSLLPPFTSVFIRRLCVTWCVETQLKWNCCRSRYDYSQTCRYRGDNSMLPNQILLAVPFFRLTWERK